MSTRAVYSFIDKDNIRFHVYKHWDNYPERDDNAETGAYVFIRQAKELAWDLPRFEASEFAAAFIARHKHEGGGVYMTRGWGEHGDLSYRYEIRPVGDKLEVRTYDRYDPTNKFPRVLI